MHLQEENCAQYKVVSDQCYASYDYNYLRDYFYLNYNRSLSSLIDIPNLSKDDMNNICSYIYWAQYANLTLNFTVSRFDLDYCDGYGDSKEYTISYGQDRLWELSSFEFINQLIEISRMLQRDNIRGEPS